MKVGNTGNVYAVDVQEAKLAATQSAARQNGLKNITVVKADLDKPLLDISEGSCDAVIIASIIHEIDSKDMLLKNCYRLLKTGGRLLAVEWKKQATPIGPAIERRVSQSDLEAMLSKIGMRKEKDIDADSYHYAVVFIK
jgi:ubiquinone/menaquinone biosynthesis C-methylase UbiE